MDYKDTICTNFVVKNKQRLPYGDKAQGKVVPAEKGRHAIYVPSFGILEQEEIDDIISAAQEKEDNRLKQREFASPQKEALSNLTQAALQAPQGKRKQTIDKILGGK